MLSKKIFVDKLPMKYFVDNSNIGWW